MEEKRFNPQKLDKLNNLNRLEDFPVDFVLKHINNRNPKVIVDVGAGTGLFSRQFAKIFPQSIIHALDISDIMVDWMNENIIHDYRNILPAKMEDNRTFLEDHVADIVFMVNLHHELDNPEKMLQECYRILKSNGSVAISDWRKEETEHGPSMSLRFEAEQVETQMVSAGFKNVKTYNNFPNNFVIIGKK